MATIEVYEDPMIMCKSVESGKFCGFRVPEWYFETKKQFTPGSCPRCNMPTMVVDGQAIIESVEWTMDIKTGRILKIKVAA